MIGIFEGNVPLILTSYKCKPRPLTVSPLEIVETEQSAEDRCSDCVAVAANMSTRQLSFYQHQQPESRQDRLCLANRALFLS